MKRCQTKVKQCSLNICREQNQRQSKQHSKYVFTDLTEKINTISIMKSQKNKPKQNTHFQKQVSIHSKINRNGNK